MSLHTHLFFCRRAFFLALPALFALMCGAYAAEGALPPSTSFDQALPLSPPPDGYYNSPLAAGTLTLQDVLEAHKPAVQSPSLPAIATPPATAATAPTLTPPKQSSSTGLMMSEGMKQVLQKIGDPSVAPIKTRAAADAADSAVNAAQTAPVPLTPAASAATDEPALRYQPGQAPRNLAAEVTASPPLAPGSSEPVAPPPAKTASLSAAATCTQTVQTWEKSCGDAGYPATYVGKITGETRSGCSDGALHDIWVTNTCAPPDLSLEKPTKLDGQCGAASGNSYDDAPASNLCVQGDASAVNGSGPWTWACAGSNGGVAAACSATKRFAPVNGVCGAANGAPVESAPAANLCRNGRASKVQGSGPWTWSCDGFNDGGSQSCIAPAIEQKDQKQGPAAATPTPNEVAPAAPVSTTDQTAAPATAVGSDKDDLCGEAADILAYQAPDKDLCRIGNASVVEGDGPWHWICTGNDGRTSSCRTLSLSPDLEPTPQAAPTTSVVAVPQAAQADQAKAAFINAAPASTPAPAPLACGSAAGQAASRAPKSGLCDNGKAGSVRGDGPWRWTCSRGHEKISCATIVKFDGMCGAANGMTLKVAPFAGLCSAGTPTGVSGNGPWTWSCNGSGGGDSVSCAAAAEVGGGIAATRVDGVCGALANTTLAAAPGGADLCASGSASPVSGNGPWSWSCSGSNGGAVSSCAAQKAAAPAVPGPSVNGLCGYANGATAASAPAQGLCDSGTPTNVVGSGPWNWSCLGDNGGMVVSCTAPLQPPAAVDGVCGGASGASTLVKPQSGLCASGLAGAVSGNGPWTWSCSGVNGGNAVSCVAPVAGKSAPLPSLSRTGTVAPSAAALVTPQLPSDDMPPRDNQGAAGIIPAKSFAPPPQASEPPLAAAIHGGDLPADAPGIPSDQPALQPPSFSNTLPSAPVLQESPANLAAIPGNHLTLDPTVSTIIFAHGSGNIDPAALPNLDRLAVILNGNPDVRVTLLAYADNKDSTPRDARRLSLARALAVRDYLGAQGVSASRIDVRAEGANGSASTPLDGVAVQVNK